MASTSPWGIVYPTTGNAITPLATQFANLANSVDAGLTSVRRSTPPVAANAGARDTLFPSPVQGDRVWRSDLGADEIYYSLYNSTTNPGGRTPAGWYSPYASGLVPIRPTSVTGCVINADNSISATGSSPSWTINGVFTPAYRKYLVEFYFRFSGNVLGSLQLRGSGANLSAGYAWSTMEGTDSNAPLFASFNTQTNFPLNNRTAQMVWGSMDFTNPASAGTNYTKTWEGKFFSDVGVGPAAAYRHGFVSGVNANSYDGFYLSTGNVSLYFQDPSVMKIYGYN